MSSSSCSQEFDLGNVCINSLRSVSGPQPYSLSTKYVSEQNGSVAHHSDSSKKRFPLIRSGSFQKDSYGGASRGHDAIPSSQHNDIQTVSKDVIMLNDQQRLCRPFSFPHSKRTDFGRSRAMKLSGEMLQNHQEAEHMLLASSIGVDPSRISSDLSCLPVSQMEKKIKCMYSPVISKLERDKVENDLFPGSKKLQSYEDLLVKLDSKLESQFERLVSAIDGVMNQMQIEFCGLNERIDCLQRSLESEQGSGWKIFINRLHQQMIDLTDGSCPIAKKFSAAAPVHSHPLRGAIETARGNIGLLSGLLIVEKDAYLMRVRDFQDRHTMVLRMMRPYLKKPIFQQFWHMKHGVDHCVASVLFKTSHILARTVSNNSSEVSMEASITAVQGEAADQFNRFCKRGAKGVEEFAEWPEGKWSEHLKREFLRSCKAVWQIQRMVAALKLLHEVEILHPHPGSKLDELIMDPLEYSLPEISSSNHERCFEPLVQFTVFPGFKIDGSDVLCKAQVYLQPKRITPS